jgi:hypothetical protein
VGRFQDAIGAIDALNAEDPVRLVVDGVERPKELVHAEAMTGWVLRLAPDADEAQLLAARAHHLRRWAVPRSSYPEGRAGYLRWRADQKRRHAEEVGEVLSGVGYDEAVVERVGAIIRKERDPAVQVHEDALCLVFLSLQAEDAVATMGEDKALEVLVKTLRKMSDRGRAEVEALVLPPSVRTLVDRAVAVERAATGPHRPAPDRPV